MTPAMFFDSLAVRLNGPKAAARRMEFNIHFTDSGERFALSLRRAVLVAEPGTSHGDALASLACARRVLYAIAGGVLDVGQAIADGKLKVEGEAAAFGELLALLDSFDPWFGIATP